MTAEHRTRLLLVEDDIAIAHLVRKLFAKWAPGDFVVEWLTGLAGEPADVPDVLLLDPGLRDTAWADSVALARSRWPKATIIVLTNGIINGEANSLREAGASSCFEKIKVLNDRNFAILLRALRRGLGQRGNVDAEIALSRAVHRIESSPVVRKVLGYVAGTILAAGGGGGVAWAQCSPKLEQPYETKEHAAEVVTGIKEDVSRIDVTTQRLDVRSVEMLGTLNKISGYLDAAKRRSDRADRR